MVVKSPQIWVYVCSETCYCSHESWIKPHRHFLIHVKFALALSQKGVANLGLGSCRTMPDTELEGSKFPCQVTFARPQKQVKLSHRSASKPITPPIRRLVTCF